MKLGSLMIFAVNLTYCRVLWLGVPFAYRKLRALRYAEQVSKLIPPFDFKLSLCKKELTKNNGGNNMENLKQMQGVTSFLGLNAQLVVKEREIVKLSAVASATRFLP